MAHEKSKLICLDVPKTPDHYTFKPAEASLPVISASGSGAVYSYHGPHSRTGATLQLAALDSNTCVCDGGKKGSINGIPFHKVELESGGGDCNCVLTELRSRAGGGPGPAAQPNLLGGDLPGRPLLLPPRQHPPRQTPGKAVTNPQLLIEQQRRVWIVTSPQTPPSEKLTYHMKFRFWFQPYSPASSSSPASHTNLLRMYLQTEAWAGEYDVPQCAPGTPAHSCVHQITAHFTVKAVAHNLHPNI